MSNKVRYRYNKELLVSCMERDSSTLIENYKKLGPEEVITYNCKCGKQCKKTFRRINTNGGAYCKECNDKSKRKTERPDKDALLTEISELGYSAVGRKYGVSDNAVRKWLKK